MVAVGVIAVSVAVMLFVLCLLATCEGIGPVDP